MNASDPPQSITINQTACMVNCGLVNGLPTTRFGTRVVPLSGDDAEFVAVNNVQGSTFFNPAKGQGGIILADSSSMIPVAVAGRKFVVNVEGRRENSKGTIRNVTAGKVTSSQLHTVWWQAAENLLLAQDGQSNCWIWDATNEARFSAGYNTTDKLKSKIPNGGTVMAYAHGRLIQVVNSRFILAGDSLHRTDQSSASNLEDFVEQVYWATGQYFLPPTSSGNILAAANLPLRNTQHGHGETFFFLEDGVISIDFNIFPRSKWSETPMVKTALKSCGATGPYALGLSDGDIFFRSRKGIQSLRSAAVQAEGGNPNSPISGEVSRWLRADYPRWLRFASMNLWDKGNRLLCTTSPMVYGRFRWHRGLVVRNMEVSETSRAIGPAWEGLWTLPPQTFGVIQLVNGLFDGDERQFAWVRGQDQRNRLVEFTTYLREDVLEDGRHVPIPCQVITRAFDAGKWWEVREYRAGRLYLRNIVGKVQWGVWYRTAETAEWNFWRAGWVENSETCDACDLEETAPAPFVIPLGRIPEKAGEETCPKKESRWMQFLVRWVGHCQMENLRISYGQKDLTDDEAKESLFNFTLPPGNGCSQDDFEYTTQETPSWITNERNCI